MEAEVTQKLHRNQPSFSMYLSTSVNLRIVVSSAVTVATKLPTLQVSLLLVTKQLQVQVVLMVVWMVEVW